MHIVCNTRCYASLAADAFCFFFGGASEPNHLTKIDTFVTNANLLLDLELNNSLYIILEVNFVHHLNHCHITLSILGIELPP